MSFKYDEIKCPECGGPMVMVSRTGKYGVFWGCKGFPACKGTRDNLGRSKADREAEKFDREVREETKNNEWNRNVEDKISWNKKQ